MVEQQSGASIPRVSPPLVRLPRILLACIALGGLGIAWFLATDAAVYLHYTGERYTDYYWSRRAGLILHVSAGTLALTTGLVQVYLGLSGRTRCLHRIFGRVYLLAVFLGVSASAYLAATIPDGSPVYTSGLVGLGIAWTITTFKGYRRIIRGDAAGHRAWMLRSYAVTFGFVTLRVIVAIIAGLGLMSEDDANSPAAWLCWIIPLALLEIGYRRWHWGGTQIPAVEPHQGSMT